MKFTVQWCHFRPKLLLNCKIFCHHHIFLGLQDRCQRCLYIGWYIDIGIFDTLLQVSAYRFRLDLFHTQYIRLIVFCAQVTVSTLCAQFRSCSHSGWYRGASHWRSPWQQQADSSPFSYYSLHCPSAIYHAIYCSASVMTLWNKIAPFKGVKRLNGFMKNNTTVRWLALFGISGESPLTDVKMRHLDPPFVLGRHPGI